MSVLTAETLTAPPQTLHFMSEAEFEAWCDEDVKAEYIDGEVIIMSPASTDHDGGETVLGNLIDLFVKKNRLGYVSSTGNTLARLRSGLRRCPDIVFVENSNRQIIQKNYIDGAPDLVVEFVSPDSVIRDWHEKYIEYEAAGVREYWIVDQLQKRIAVFALDKDRRYQPIEPKEGKIYSKVLSGFWIKLDWFWQGPEFDTYQMAKEIGIIS